MSIDVKVGKTLGAFSILRRVLMWVEIVCYDIEGIDTCRGA